MGVDINPLNRLSGEQVGELSRPENQLKAWKICFGEDGVLDINKTFSLTPEKIEELKQPENQLKAWRLFGEFTAGVDEMDRLGAVFALAHAIALDLSPLRLGLTDNPDDLWRNSPSLLKKLASSRRATSDYQIAKDMGLREEEK